MYWIVVSFPHLCREGSMKKLGLDLDGLRVESFAADAPTADALAARVPPTYDRSCILSCPIACG
jgi:hypothetical protein